MTGRNIRGIKFNKDLNDRNFQGAQAGQKLPWKILLTTFSIVIASICSLVPAFSGVCLATIVVFFGENRLYTLGTGLVVYILALILFTVYTFEIGIFIVIITAIITSIIAPILESSPDPGGFVIFLVLSIVFAWLGEIITAFWVAFIDVCCGTRAQLLACFGAGLVIVIATNGWLSTSQEMRAGEGITIMVTAFTVILVGLIIAKQALKGNYRFTWLAEKAIFWAAINGTSFYNTDLTDACFDDADLRHTDLRKANLTRTSFRNTINLELARLQGTILDQPNVRHLLVTHAGSSKDFTEANLCGANLRGANLREAILIRAQLLDADLSGACLTDACIQDWNINHNTRFNDVDCKRVYLKRSSSGHFLEPKPDSGEFGPGEFEKWITDVRDTIDLIFQNGLNWRAFAFSLTQTAINNEGIDLSVRSIENKGDGVVIAKVGVSLDTNKTSIHQEITEHYHDAVAAIEAKYELVLKAKDDEIERLVAFHETQQKFIQGLVAGIAEPKEKVLIQGEGNRVYVMNQTGDVMENSNQNNNAGGDVDMSSGAKVSVGGDLTATGSSITLGDLNGQVTNTIQQLQDIDTSSGKELGQILSALQGAINSDAALSTTQKEQALEAVATLAEEGKKSPESRVNKLCLMAMNALKGVASTVTDASKLAEMLKTSLPTLTKLLGL
jgi:uncharacterized protein YjbI with pentapeptide repeats